MSSRWIGLALPWAVLLLALAPWPGAGGSYSGAPIPHPGGVGAAPEDLAARPTGAPVRAPVPTATVFNYSSSNDSFPLSYTEVLPAGYSPSTRYPLLVELHGISLTESTPMAGGYPTGLDNATIDAASAAGFILEVPNSRTGDGFYVDSPSTGPQAQDVQDAIQVEESQRSIGAVYLYGFSMGAMGALSIGLQHPTEFAGLGAIATFSDIYELYAYQAAHNSTPLNDALLAVAGGSSPNASAFSRRVFDELSELRAHPTLTKGIRMYLASGGVDSLAPDNPTLWPYLQGNDTAIQTTCDVATGIGEASNCTLPLAALHAADPVNYSYRFVYEPNGGHAYQLVNVTDMLAFFVGSVPDGTYDGRFPVPSPSAPPVPLVTLVTQPFGCGTIAWNGLPFPNGFTIPQPAAEVPITVTPCPGYNLSGLQGRDGVSVDPAAAMATVTGSGALVATFAPINGSGGGPGNLSETGTLLVTATGGCAAVSVNATLVPTGSGVTLPLGEYVAEAPPCLGFAFLDWTWSGAVQVWNPTAATTGLRLSGNGSLAANYVPLTGTFAVTIAIDPAACGPISINGTAVANGSVVPLLAGSYQIVAGACSGRAFTAWLLTGSLAGGGGSPVASVSVSGAGSLTARYSQLVPPLYGLGVNVSPSSCGSVVSIDDVRYADGTSAWLAPGDHALSAGICPGFIFDGWTVSGGAVTTGATLSLTGNGTLTAGFAPSTTPLPPTSAAPFPPDWAAPYVWVGAGGLVGAVLGVAIARRRARPTPPA